MDSRTRLLGYAGLVLTALFWAGNAVVARGTAGEIPPLALSFWRWMIALALLAPFGIPRLARQWPVVRARWPALLALATLSVGAFNTLLYLAAQSTGAINITLVNATIPIVVALFAWGLLGEAVSRLQALGIAAALTGMLTIVARGDPDVLLAVDINAGDGIMVAAVFVWGGYSVLLRRTAPALHPIALLTALVLLGLPVILPFYLWELAATGGFDLRAEMLPAFVYVGIFPSVLAYLFWNHGVQTIGPTRSAVFIYLLPVFASILAVAFLGEALHPYHAGGGLLILVGLYLASRFGPAAQPVAASDGD
ncbi:DMT family transporter [Ectothiorhodospiraceae bacterium WFHF3C12]|nr:DMT family transporter [Ectothiorhodospiraceae bacterium WFHF3C12]